MNWLHPAALLLAAWLVAFGQSWFTAGRGILLAQPDLLPALVVYSALYAGLPTTAAVAVLGGLGSDALSSGPFGLGVVPLVVLGAVLHWRREVILRDSVWAQAALGGAATFGVTVASLGLLFVLWPVLSGWPAETPYWPERRSGLHALPEPGLGLIWQWLAVSAVGALATPVLFRVFRGLDRMLSYQPAPLPPARGTREIRRGRT